MGFDSDSNADRNKIYQVEELTPSTILEVAERVAVASSFEDLIYRESEIDALWSLADIAAKTDSAAQRWADLRDRIGVAHDLVPEGEVTEAAEVLRQTATMV